MKLCDIALFSPDTSSGVKTYIDSKIDYVRERVDVDHVVIVPGRHDEVRRQGRSKVIVVRGVGGLYPGIHVGLNIFKIADLIEAEAPDLIEVNCQYTMAWAAFLATRRSRAPVVGVYHTDVPACVAHWARRAGWPIASFAERAMEWYEGMIYRHCTLTVILNPAMTPRLGRLGVQRLRYLPCGVDATTFHPGRRDSDLRASLGIGNEETAILYVGRLSPEKEVDVLLAAYDQLPGKHFRLLIAGDGPDASRIAQYAAARSGVRYLGHIAARNALAALYASADVFVTPGRFETFGMATLEAIACGLPVVGIRESGTASFVSPHLGVLARGGDAAELAGAIAVVDTWDRSGDRRASAHAAVASSFAWPAVLAQYFETYRELIEVAVAARERRGSAAVGVA